MLNSAEHEILNAHKYNSIKKLSILQAQISIESGPDPELSNTGGHRMPMHDVSGVSL